MKTKYKYFLYAFFFFVIIFALLVLMDSGPIITPEIPEFDPIHPKHEIFILDLIKGVDLCDKLSSLLDIDIDKENDDCKLLREWLKKYNEFKKTYPKD